VIYAGFDSIRFIVVNICRTKGAFMKKFSFLLVAAILIGCGGGGGGSWDEGVGGLGGAVVTPQEGLTGQYTMTGVRYEFSDGLVATENDLVPWGGHMDIGNTTMDIQMTLLGNSTQTGGSYSTIWSSATAGEISDGYDSIPFTLSNGKMTLIFWDLEIDVGLTADVFLYWQKVSDSHVSKSIERESVGTNDVNIFGSISRFMKSHMK
jgi:hypothetical protein